MLERIRRLGPIGFDEYVDAALYDPEAGFYSSGRGAGRGADFLTSPEVGPLFGAVLARAIDAWWDELGCPDPFVVVEAAAATGTLAASILAAQPRCGPALRYVLVERSAALRDAQRDRLRLEPPELALGPEQPSMSDEDEADRPHQPGTGPFVTSLGELPAGPLTGVVIANELLDNLAFVLCERTGDGWAEVRVGAEDGGLEEILVPASPELAIECQRLAPAAGPGARVPIQHHAIEWVRAALGLLDRGRVVTIDYAATTAELAARPWLDWVRTYRSHGRGGHPLDDPGSQDVTCEVALDQLGRAGAPAATTQAEFLRAHGIDDLVGEARATWHERAAAGDLEALKARSRVGEAAALCDPAGLGNFVVLTWQA